ncbi:glycosyltransferase [Microbacterium esteraromaticum]|nr:glycosyltransferase [Microbacterium esteraromaticum]
MNARTIVVDFLAQPALLPMRERARALHKLSVGLRNRVRMQRRTRYVSGMLSIVVPMYRVERYIAECLDSLLVQDYANIQIVVVDDGSPDGSYDVARRFAHRDPRVKIVRQANEGLSGARNTGVRHARGEFLAFLDSDDFVDRHTYREAIDALRESGSDFAVLPYRREKNGTFQAAAPWILQAHRSTRLATTLNEFPEIMVNAVAWSKVYRRDFWDANRFAFPVGLLYEDQALSMAAFAAAGSFDVLSRVSVNWRIRGDQSSITQQVTSARNIADHAVAVHDSIDELRRHGAVAAVIFRVAQIMNNNLREFLPNIRQMDDMGWEQFRQFLLMLCDHADERVWKAVEARIKVLIGLCAANRRDLALRFLEAGGWERDHFAGTVSGAELIADLPLADELATVLPAAALVFSNGETELSVVGRKLAVGHAGFSLEAIAYINHLRMDVEETELRGWLVTPWGECHPLSVERRLDAWAAYGHTRRYADMSSSAVVVSVPFELVKEPGEYTLRFEMRCGELRREGLLSVDGRTTFRPAMRVRERTYVALESDANGIARLVARTMVAELTHAVTGGSNVAITLESDLPLQAAYLVRTDDRFQLRRARTLLRPLGSGIFTADIELPRARNVEIGAHQYSLLVIDGISESYEVGSSGLTVHAPASDGMVQPGLHALGEIAAGVIITELRRSAIVTGVTLEDDALIIDFDDRHTVSPLETVGVEVGSSRVDAAVEREDGRSRIVVPLYQDAWGLGAAAIPSGDYRFAVIGADAEELVLYVNAALADQLPLELDHAALRVSVRRSRRGYLRISMSAPLSDSERGGGDRWRMREQFFQMRPSGPRSIVFRNLYGDAANDSALAVYHELKKRGSNLEMIWAIRDNSIHVPAGARTVLEESAAYYHALGTANYVMVNVHQPDWYRKPEGQILIETFHGYPFKMNGHRWWKKLGFTPERQESFFRRAEEWDYLISPARYATQFLREFYRETADIDTEILEIGYPRNDAIINGEAGKRRADARRRLGIPEGKKAILYAPTFRDYLSGDDMSASLVEFFDTATMMRRLGPDYLLLMRGHPFNARSGTKSSSSFVNVTDYPDINHLILASDIGVLDYSSLRFDYALTGKPTFYFVPDLERYFDGRESFVPYEDTSPGPHMRTMKELVDGIRVADQIAAEFDPARRRFIATFMELEDGRAAERLVNAVFVPRGDA